MYEDTKSEAHQSESVGSPEWLCELARPLIQSKARRLVGMAGITRSDCEDIEQEAYLRLLQRFDSRPDGCHWMVFVTRVVDQAICNELRHRSAQRRDASSVRPLSTPIADSDGPIELVQTIDESNLDARLGRQSREVREYVEMGIDMEAAIADLSDDLQECCRFLRIESISELSRRLGKPRTTIQDKVEKIRRKWQGSPLREYLQ